MRRFAITSLILVLCAGWSSWSQAPMPVQPLRTAADRPIDIKHIRLDLKVDLPGKTVTGQATLRIRTLRKLSGFALDAVEFEVKQVSLEQAGQPAATARFHHDGKKLRIDLEPAWPTGTEATVRIQYQVKEPKAGLHFFGPTRAEPKTPLTVWSQGEPVTNRYWFPCLDHPNQKQTTELVVTVADGFEVLSNGKLVSRKVNPDKSVTFHWSEENLHVAYLVTLVVGQFDVVREEWNGKPVLYYVPRGKKDDVPRSFGRTRQMLDYFSKIFGPYPWEKYAQVVVEQFTHGGMENTGATTLTEWALHDARAMLDSSPDGLISHELAHQWWGDLVTCKDWAHLWLNEGFASYAEALWAEKDRGADAFTYNMLGKQRAAMSEGTKRPIVDRRYPNPGSMFDARAYPKGAWVLHMLRRQLGDETFWKCLQAYARAYQYQSVETSDFRKVLEKETGRNLERFFHDWTEMPGHPVLEVSSEYQPDHKLLKVAVKQTQPGEAFHFPLVIQCLAGERFRFEQSITGKEHSFYLPLATRPTVVEIDPDLSLLAELKENKGRDLWRAQLGIGADAKTGPSVASRIRAVRELGKSKSPKDRELLAKALATESFWGAQAEIAAALAESGGDPCRDALIAGLQHKHPKVRRACAENLGKFHRDAKAAAALRLLLQKGDPSYFAEANALKAYAQLERPDTVEVLLPWLAKPSHRDVLCVAALQGLGNSQDLSALGPIIAWTKRGKPRLARVAALQALAQLALKANPSDEQRQRIVKEVAACLQGESTPVRLAAVNTLRDLGRSAAPTLEALEAIARHDPSSTIRDLARKAGDKVRSNSPVPVELTRLRDELDRLRKANDALKERLDRIEHK